RSPPTASAATGGNVGASPRFFLPERGPDRPAPHRGREEAAVTNPTDQADRLAAVLAPVLADAGVTLYDVEVVGAGRTRTLRVLVDREGGVDLAAVTAATEALGPVLDTDPVVAA